MKKIFILIAGIGILALLFMAGNIGSKETVGAGNSEAAVVGALRTTPTKFDFGKISMKQGKVSQMFTVENKSEAPVTIRKVTTSCMCTEAFIVQNDARKGPFGMPGHGSVPLVNETVPANGTVGIEVVYDPAAHGPAGIGQIERAVFIEDENGVIQTLTVKALVTP